MSEPPPLHLGIDLGGTNVKTALLDAAGAIVERSVIPTQGHDGAEAVLDRMAAEALRLRDRAGGRIASAGLGVPGMIDMSTGIVIDVPNLPGHWVDVPAGPRLAAALGVPVDLINDARAFGMAEATHGAARGADTALFMTLGTGIGGAVLAHGRILFGVGGAAGEFGHLIVDPNGLRCGCGARGCVEAYASGPAIVSEANRRVRQGFTTRLADLIDGDLSGTTPEIVAQAAREGDADAIEVLSEAGRMLGLALAGAIALIAPEVVVIGGGVAGAGGVLWQSMEETCRTHCHVTDIDRIRIVPAALGYEAGVIGAAAWGARTAGEAT
jgi:glucokinase